MLCAHCGAETPPELDLCVVCRTPHDVETMAPASSSGDDPDLTHAITTPGPPSSGTSGPPRATTSTLLPGQEFANRYRIIRQLGAGGMAVVYQAWDDALGMAVALKLIRFDGVDPYEIAHMQDRFKRELKLARQVTHTNVVRIHDLGEVGGVLYLTMEFVQGADLATLIRRDGKIPLARAIAIMRQIVNGLIAAHEAGVIHRDLKPAN